MSDFDALVVRLRRWTHNHDPHVRAAVELLIEHETWIRRGDFQRACGRAAAQAIKINRIRRVVNISSIGAHLGSGTGLVNPAVEPALAPVMPVAPVAPVAPAGPAAPAQVAVLEAELAKAQAQVAALQSTLTPAPAAAPAVSDTTMVIPA